MNLGVMEIGLILVVVLILFGPSRLPGLGKSLGEAIRGFKKGISTDEEQRDVSPEKKADQLNDRGPTMNSQTKSGQETGNKT